MRSPALDVYLLPAVVGGGAGDVEEVLCAGRQLARAGFPVSLYLPKGRPLPRGVDGPWDWPPLRRRLSLSPRARAALTVAPAWGVSCAPARDGPFGRPGPWAEEAAEIERTYGPARTLHVSLEEFARTLTPVEETRERLREGGVRRRAIPSRLARARAAGEIAAYRSAFRTFRAFDRGNVVHLFATFRFARSFAREFPEAVQTGPLVERPRAKWRRRSSAADWVWYASPASAERLAPEVVAGLRARPPAPALLVRTPRPWREPSGGEVVRTAPLEGAPWRRAFAGAAVRIVTGSRTLLEALAIGGPFLYFNGVLGHGSARRRHRPEKIAALLALAREDGWPPSLLRDLADFSAGRRVADVVSRAARGAGAWRNFPSAPRPRGFAPGFSDASAVVLRLARAMADGRASAFDLVARERRRAHR